MTSRVITVLTGGQKFDILDDFTVKVGKMKLEFRSECEHIESMGGPS